MDDKEKLEVWKRKVAKIENKAGKLDGYKNILTGLFNEVKTRQNIRLNNSLKGMDLAEEISHIKDWVEFHEKEISIYKDKISALEIKVSRDDILEQEVKGLDEEAKEITGKETDQKYGTESPEVEIPSLEEIKKDAEELQKYTQKKENGIEAREKPPSYASEPEKEKRQAEEKPALDIQELEEKIPEFEKPDFLVAGGLPVKEDEKEAIAITRLFDESSDIKSVREQLKGLFKDKRDIARHLRLRKKLNEIKYPIRNTLESISSGFGTLKTSVNSRLEPLRAIDKKYVIYTMLILLLLVMAGIFFASKPEITGYVTLTKEKTYTNNLNLVINESGNYTWMPDNIGDIQSIKAAGRVKGNGTVRVYIEKDGEMYLIYDNKKG